MCAIIGSSSISMFEILYQANVTRGNFASSLMCLVERNDQHVLKQYKSIDFDNVGLDPNSEYYIGHAQAPTSSNRTWSYDTSHPFESISWSVMHNGVLTNSKELNEKYTPWNVNPVDTAVIPALLQKFTEECKGECPSHEIIKRVLSLLEGTFALCIVDTDVNDVYLARQGSILHYNNAGDFSSLSGNGFMEVKEGDIMMLQDYSSWKTVNTFNHKSPFLFI